MFAGVQKFAYLSGICHHAFVGVYGGSPSTAALLLPCGSEGKRVYKRPMSSGLSWLPAKRISLQVYSARRLLIYRDNPGALVQASGLAMFSASTVGVAVGALPSLLPGWHPPPKLSEGPARLSLFTGTRARRNLLARCALRRSSRHVNQATT